MNRGPVGISLVLVLQFGYGSVQLFNVNYFCRRIASPKTLPNESGCLK